MKKITFAKSVMKKGIDICKTIDTSKTKEKKIWIFTIGKNNIFMYTSRDKLNLMYFHHIYSTEPIEEPVSFLANPTEFEKLFKEFPKEKELTFEFKQEKNDNYLSVENGTKKIKIEYYEGKMPIPKVPYKNLDFESTMNIIDLAANSIGKTTDYTIFGGQQIFIQSRTYYKRFNFTEPINSFAIPPEYLNILSKKMIRRKTDQKQLAFFDNGKSLFIRFTANAKEKTDSFRQLFVFKNLGDIAPPIRTLEEQIVHSFKVDSDTLLGFVSSYPASVSDLYLYNDGEELVIDPYDKPAEQLKEEEKEPIYRLPYEGNVKRTKISVEALKALLTGHSGIINIDIHQFEEDDEIFHYLKIYEPSICSVAVVKKEPNYAKVQKKLDEIIERQKELKYI